MVGEPRHTLRAPIPAPGTEGATSPGCGRIMEEVMMLRTSRRGIALASTALLAVVGMGALSACSSSSEPAASPTASASETASPSETGTSVLPPVIVEPGQNEVTAKVGDTIVINVDDPVNEAITTNDPTILEVVPGSDDGSAVFNPGAVALTAGTATLTLTNAETGTERVITVTVTE